MDDLVIAGTKEAVDNVKTLMLRKYKMKDLGEIHLILGCEVKYDRVSGEVTNDRRAEEGHAGSALSSVNRKSAMVGNWFTLRYCVCGLMLCEILHESWNGALDCCIKNTSILERDKKLWACLPQGSETRRLWLLCRERAGVSIRQ